MSEATTDWKQHWGHASDYGIGAATVDVEPYVSPAVFAEEREKIFRRVWFPVARESEIPQSGDFIRCEIPPLESEAILVRGKDNELRAFYNSCPHRGAQVVRACAGRTNLFVCPYHAWSFGTDGKCKGLPGAEQFPELDKNEVGLTPIHLDTWNGFVFLNFDEQPTQSLTEYLGEFGDLFADVPFQHCQRAIEITTDVDTNWKNFIDAFNEGYHVQSLHAKTLPMVPSQANPLNVYYDPIFIGPHSAAMVQSNPEWVSSWPVVNFIYSALGASLIQKESEKPGATDGAASSFMSAKGINRIGLPNFGLSAITLFPLAQMQVFADRFLWYHFWPISVDKTRFVLRMYNLKAPSNWLEAFAEGHMVANTRDILSEDVAMANVQQIGMKGGGKKQIHFGENELMVRFNQQVIQEYLAGKR